MNRKLFARVSLIALLLLSTSPLAQGFGTLSPAPGETRRVRFARGRTTAVLKGAVIRATRDRYILGARRGQTMIVHITSLEKNAVFSIVAPDGTPLMGAEEDADTMDWTGQLPMSGDFSIWVSPTRGNATYTLEVTIR